MFYKSRKIQEGSIVTIPNADSHFTSKFGYKFRVVDTYNIGNTTYCKLKSLKMPQWGIVRDYPINALEKI